MVAFTDFLANNYLWFLVISLILVFSLIGYFVDKSEQEKGISKIIKPKEEEQDIHELAVNAANKSLNAAVSDAVKNNGQTVTANYAQSQNTIMDMTNQNIQNNPSSNTTTVGFDVLSK